MPSGDRTGPAGKGPKTGRGLGFCAGFNKPGNKNTSRRRQGTGGGGGRKGGKK